MIAVDYLNTNFLKMSKKIKLDKTEASTETDDDSTSSEDEMARKECIVSSELLPYLDVDKNSKPIVNEKNIVSKFTFRRKCKKGDHEYDEDGDLIINYETCDIYTEHSMSTSLDCVGLQVWRGALLLADWIIHNENLLKDSTILELGSGTGLTAIAAASVGKQVIATDADIGDVLNLIEANIHRNESLLRNSVAVLELDFFNTEWSPQLKDFISKTNVIIAADIIYDDDLTDAFVETLKKLLRTPPSKTFYMVLEKRYVFTLEELDSVAPCFEHFLRLINKPDFPWKLESVSCNFPQYFKYEKTKELAMWKIVA